MTETRPPAVVIGLDSMQGIQTARILSGHSIDVIGIAGNLKHHCCKTNTCREIFRADTQSEQFLEVLDSISKRYQDRPVLYPCHDDTVRILSRHRDRLEENFRIVLPDAATIDMLSHKVSFFQFAQREGLPIPTTHIIRSQADADSALQNMTFPAVLKPSARTRLWDQNTMSKVYRVASKDDFQAIYRRCRDWVDTLVLQEWIEGGDDSLYSCNCYFSKKGEPLCTFVARKLRQWPPQIGVSSLGEEVKNDFVLEQTLRLFQLVNYRGLGYVEFKRNATNGEYYIVEPNVGRPTGRSAIAEAGGVEMLLTMYCDSVDLPLPEKRVQKFTGAKWVDIRHDFQSALHYWWNGKLSLKEWYRSWKGPKAHTYFSWKDPKPFFYDLLTVPRRLFANDERSKRDYLRVQEKAPK